MDERRPYARTTALGLALMALTTAVFAAFSITQLVNLRGGGDRLESDQVIMGIAREGATNSVVLGAGVILVISLLALSMTIGVARRRNGPRHAAIALFVVLGTVSLAAALTGLASDPPARNAGWGVAVGLVDFAVVALLSAQSTADDFGHAEVLRQRRLARH